MRVQLFVSKGGKKFYLADRFLRNVTQNSILTMTEWLLDGPLRITKRVQQIVVRLVLIRPNMPNRVKRIATCGCIVHPKQDVTPQTFTNKRTRNSGSNMCRG